MRSLKCGAGVDSFFLPRVDGEATAPRIFEGIDAASLLLDSEAMVPTKPFRATPSKDKRFRFLEEGMSVHTLAERGRAAGDLGRGLRSVAWERASGQAVQALLTVTVLLLLPPPGSSFRLVVACVVAAVAGVAARAAW